MDLGHPCEAEEETTTATTTTTTTTMLSNNNIPMNTTDTTSIKRRYQGIMLFYSVLFLFLTYQIAITLYKFPLFPFQSDSLEWSVAWLFTTIIDYYGVTLCFGGIVLSSELLWWKGVAWNVGFCLGGSPICCLWMICWTYKGRALTLSQNIMPRR